MEDVYVFKSRTEYFGALDSVLPDDYVQRRDTPSGVYRYVPAPVKEALADKFFQYWNVIDEDYTLIANELVCTVKLAYQPSFPGADELFCTGSAAVAIQMSSGASVKDFPGAKKTNALEYNLPSSRIEAISNALGTLGNVFGRNLSRKFSKKQKLPADFTLRLKKKQADG